MRINYIVQLIILAIASIGLNISPSYAAKVSGGYLYQMCSMNEKKEETVKGGHVVCQSYISGVIDYHNVLRALNIAPKVDICVPREASMYDLQEIVLNYLEKNVQHDDFNASPAVTMALYEVFPCK
jgi:hypothetical protein